MWKQQRNLFTTQQFINFLLYGKNFLLRRAEPRCRTNGTPSIFALYFSKWMTDRQWLMIIMGRSDRHYSGRTWSFKCSTAVTINRHKDSQWDSINSKLIYPIIDLALPKNLTDKITNTQCHLTKTITSKLCEHNFC